jgi:RNA polymerase sigma-70 factor (ECF subfamily)
MMNSPEVLKNYQEFEQTAVPHMAALHNYALHLTMNSDDAKDLVQDTYLKAMRFWNRYESGTNIKAWLYQIMKNSYINLYRKKVKEPRKVEYNEDQFHHYINQVGSFDPKHFTDKSYNEIFEDEIARSIESLSKEFQTVVLLSDYEDLSYEEIADMIDCPIGTVRSRLHRGRKQLQNKLLNYAYRNGYILKEM